MAITVSHFEVDGYPRETQERHLFKAVRKLRCAWTDAQTLRADLLKADTPYYGHLYPYDTALNARCRSATVAPAPGKISQSGISVDMADYESAIVTANYSTPQPNDPQVWPGHEPETYISESLASMTEFVTLGYKNFRWGSKAGNEIEPAQAPGLLIHGLQYRFTIYSQTTVDEAYLDFLGTVNESMVTANLLDLDFQPETLLFADLNMVKGADSLWDVTYIYAIRMKGWNKWYWEDANTGVGDFVSMYHKDAADDQPHKVYKTANWFP